MGEPAHNMDNVLEAIDLLGTAGATSATRTWCSRPSATAACSSGCRAATVKPALALSLHTTDAELRAQLLPRAPRIDPAELVELGDAYARATGYPIQYQWTLLEGINDSDEELDGIVRLLAGQVRGDELHSLQRGRRPRLPAPGMGTRGGDVARSSTATASSPSCASRPARTSTAAAASCGHGSPRRRAEKKSALATPRRKSPWGIRRPEHQRGSGASPLPCEASIISTASNSNGLTASSVRARHRGTTGETHENRAPSSFCCLACPRHCPLPRMPTLKSPCCWH